jgi:hypothetical protein
MCKLKLGTRYITKYRMFITITALKLNEWLLKYTPMHFVGWCTCKYSQVMSSCSLSCVRK